MKKKTVIYINESKQRKRIEELVKGSLDYQMYEINRAFRSQFPSDEMNSWYLSEIFPNYVLVRAYGSGEQLKADEYYKVNYTRQGETIVFDARDQWQVVETTIVPKAVTESRTAVWLVESEQDGARRIRINNLMTAGVVNGNNRRYSAGVLKAAVEELRTHLHESNGQGRLMVLGEVEHPNDKGTRRANLMETVIRWTGVEFDGTNVNVTGLLATNTEGGRHIQALEAIGVVPGGSIRGWGVTETVKEGGRAIDEVTDLRITGIDLVNDPSFKEATTIFESTNDEGAEDNMKILLEKLKVLLKARPDLMIGITEADLEAMVESQLQALVEKVNNALGIDLQKVEVSETVADAFKKAGLYDEAQRKTSLETAITEATKDLPYGEEGNRLFLEAIRSANPQDAAAVKSLVEAKRKEYDKLFAGRKLEKMGFSGQISGVAPVLERETGVPEFARGAFEISERLRPTLATPRANLVTPKTIAEEITKLVLAKFDRDNQRFLLAESRMLAEAETTTDLNLPYSVSRTVIAEAFPNLVALGVFDVNVTDQAPSKIFYETFSGETGYSASISASEAATLTALDTWYNLANKRLTPGTVVVKNSAENTTYTEGTDYVIDYANGRIRGLTGGAITAGATVHLTAYSYTAIRKGENAAIERGKVTLASKTLEIAADRLADEVTREAVVFGRSQLGWDAVARTITSLINQVNRKIDGGLLYLSLAAALSVPNNSGGTWTAATDSLDDLVVKIGAARVKVANRYYTPTSILGSLTNIELLSHWDGFTAAGQRPGDERLGNGLAGSLNGLPVFWSTEHSESYIQVINREVVMHRIYQAMMMKGPFPSYDSSGKLKANEQYYVEEFNGSDAPVPEKAAYIKVA